MAKKERFITPAGIAVWPKLDVPDVYQPLDKQGKPKGAAKTQYIIRVKFSDADLAKVTAYVEKKTEELSPGGKNSPLVKDKKTGEITLKATSGAKYRPACWDSKNKRIPDDVRVGGGSKVKLDLTVNAYDGFGGGINFYINAVQVLELVDGDNFAPQFSTDEDGFEVEEESGFGGGDASGPEETSAPKTKTDRPFEL